MACQSQWQRSDKFTGKQMIRVVTGLDYSGVRAAIEMLGHEVANKELFEAVRTMESEVIKIVNESNGHRN